MTLTICRLQSDQMNRKTSYTVAVSKNNNHGIGGIFVKKGLTELIFVLDRGGSMGGLEADTIGGMENAVTVACPGRRNW